MHYIAIFTCFASIFLDTSSYAGALDFVLGAVGTEAIESRIANYGSAETDMAFNMSLTTRLIRLNNQISAIFLIALMVYLRRNWSQLHTSPYTSKLYNVLLLFIIVSYALISYSVVGQRFVYIAMVLLYIFMKPLSGEPQHLGQDIHIYDANSLQFAYHVGYIHLLQQHGTRHILPTPTNTYAQVFTLKG